MQTIIPLEYRRAAAHSTAVSNEWKGEKMLLDPENRAGGSTDAGRRFRFSGLGFLRHLFQPRTNRLDVDSMPDSFLRDIGLRDGRRSRRSTCGAGELQAALLRYPPRSV